MNDILNGRIEVVSIDSSNAEGITEFLEIAKTAKASFRYFESRPLTIIEHHKATYLVRLDNQYVGYGHLDYENEIVWLGIAIADDYQGLGLAKVIMSTLVSTAKLQKLRQIRLSVDQDNIRAIKLYDDFGFKVVKKSGDIQFMEKEL
ncbi:MAG: GNAT family N-acetyltransferase [Bacteroidia bacterium]|nr:GNAT family N-acetyltransferase [Bacteroidia bacterium]